MIQSIRTSYWNWRLSRLVSARDRADARVDAIEAKIIAVRKRLGLPVARVWSAVATRMMR